MTIEIDGREVLALQQAFDTADGRVTKAVVEAVRESGKAVADTARGLAPKRSGRMARSITSKVTTRATDVTAEVGPTAFYGHFVEHGTSRMAPRPFLGPALDTESDAAAQRIADAAVKAMFG